MYPSKRSVHVADAAKRTISCKEADEWTLVKLLDLARELSSCGRGPILMGLDVALGVPCSFMEKARQVEESSDPPSFVDWLANLDPDGPFFKKENTVSKPEEWSVERPWFRVPKGRGGLKSFAKLDERGFLRTIDTCTGSKPMFAVSGIPGTVGSGTRALWQELCRELDREDRDFVVWPFETDLDQPLKQIVLAETYPGFCYAAALSDQLPAVQVRIAKTKTSGRERGYNRLQVLKKSGWMSDHQIDPGSLEEMRANEDAFDSHLTATGMLRCTLEGRRFAEPRWIDNTAEGSMLLAGPVLPAREPWLTA